MKAEKLTGVAVPHHSKLRKLKRIICSLGNIYTDEKSYFVYTGYDCIKFDNLLQVEKAINQDINH